MKSKTFAGLLLILSLLTPAMSWAGNLSASLLYRIHFEAHHSTPTDVVVAADGSIGVYDAFFGSYLTYNSKGKAIGSVQKDFLKGGNCLTRSRDRFIFCNDSNASLDILSNNLEPTASFRLPSDMKGRYDPTDALIAGDSVYSVDNDNHRIIRTSLTVDGDIGVVGGYGQSRLSFWYPYAIAADANGLLYVSEVLNTRVQKITPDLKFYEFIGKWGIKAGEFYRPAGIAIYRGTTLLVADGYTGIIQIIDINGKFLGVLADRAGRKMELESPTHIRVNENILAAIDAYDKAVYVYRLMIR